MKTRDLCAITQWITAAATDASTDLPAVVMKRLDISRRAALSLLRRLVAAQWLVQEGTARSRGWKPGVLRQVVKRYALDGLQEDLPWGRDFAPYFALPAEVQRMAQHAFTELLNNAIDHSGGTQVTVSMRQTALHLQLLLSDDGCGLFQRIESAFDIGDTGLAMLELSKGKLTTQPKAHTGRGLYFSSRLADFFDLHANATAYQYRGFGPHGWQRSKPIARQGTSVYLAIALNTPRTLDSVLKAHSLDGAGYGFDRTVVPLQLLPGAATGLASRAQAKRVAQRLHRFRRAELDFTGITEVGHGFADEMFRVAALGLPGVDLVPVGMTPRVQALVASVLRDNA